LGVRDLVLIDPDTVEALNLNRVVTATPADVDTLKVVVARRRIREVQPRAIVQVFARPVEDPTVLDALAGVDVLIGCVDNDGARLVLNRLAVAYEIPYLDIASGIDVGGNGAVEAAGGRLATVLPTGPCLHCLGEIDTAEARYFLSSDGARAETRRLGYGRGWDDPSPSVVSLNGIVASLAITEFGMLISGLRAPVAHVEVDLLGAGEWAGPSSHVYRASSRPGCCECAYAGRGGRNDLDALIRDRVGA
jgi:hypothetical protein